MIEEGREIFRFDTFGDEAFWGDTLKLHQAIEGERFGGVGPGVSPATALAVGLKVDAEALPRRRAERDQARDRQPQRSRGDACTAGCERRRWPHRSSRHAGGL